MADTEVSEVSEEVSGAHSQTPVVIPQNVRNLHNKALAALERNNTDIAMELFTKCIQICPQFIAARRNLRLAEIAKFKMSHSGKEGIVHKLSTVAGLFKMLKVKSLVKSGKMAEAVMTAEELLSMDPLNLNFLKVFGEAAVAAGIGDAAVMSMTLAREHLPSSNIQIVELLGRLHFAMKDYAKAGEYLEKVAKFKPSSVEIAKMLKDSETLATLNSGWEDSEKKSDWRGALASQEEAEKLERENKSVKTESDAESLIEDARKKIEAEPRNMNYYFSLAGLLVQQRRYDEALEVFGQARQFAPADPELDRRTSSVMLDKFDYEIDELRKSGNEEAAAAKATERAQFEFDDIAARVGRYPNDTHLRYELGLQYYKNGYWNEAIEQLQLAQKNPKDRVSALYHLALCFREKGQLDMAVAQLDQAVELLPSMNAEKLDIYYLMGVISEEEGKIDDAAKYFKEIYRVDVRYRDISDRIDRIYAAQKKAQQQS